MIEKIKELIEQYKTTLERKKKLLQPYIKEDAKNGIKSIYSKKEGDK